MHMLFDKLHSNLHKDLTSLVVAGVGTGDEWQPFLKRYPKGHAFGFEPNPQQFKAAQKRWPKSSVAQLALWDRTCKLAMLGKKNCTRLRPPGIESKELGVNAVRLDQLRLQLGDSCFLWLDCEGAELYALDGCIGVMSSIAAINVEVRTKAQARKHYPDDFLFAHDEAVLEFLTHHGFKVILTHNVTNRKRDLLCVRM